MTSKLFSRLSLDAENHSRLREDIQKILALPDAGVPSIFRIYDEFTDRHREPGKQEAIIEANAISLGIEYKDVVDCLRAVTFFISEIRSNKSYLDDDAGEWADDINHLVSDKSVNPEFIRIFANALKDYLLSQTKKLDTILYSAGILPDFRSYGATVDRRAVFASGFKLGNDVTEYDPEIVTTIPMATIKIGTTDDDSIFFQANMNDIDMLIQSLSATAKEMKVLGGSQ